MLYTFLSFDLWILFLSVVLLELGMVIKAALNETGYALLYKLLVWQMWASAEMYEGKQVLIGYG